MNTKAGDNVSAIIFSPFIVLKIYIYQSKYDHVTTENISQKIRITNCSIFCRNKSKTNVNIHGTVRTQNLGRQQVQSLIHRRLPFDGTGSNNFTIRHSILHSSDWDEEAELQTNVQAIQQEGLLYCSESIKNLASNLRSEPMSSTQTNIVMPTAVTNYASVNFTQYSTPISTELSKICEKIKTEINNEYSDNPSPLSHKTSEVLNERLDNSSHLRHKTSEATNERLDNPSHLKHETAEVTNECSDNPSHLKRTTGIVTNQNNEKSQTALNQEEPENVTLISVSVSGRKHDTNVNKMLNSYHKAHTLDNFPRSAYERMNRAKALNKCLQIKFEDDSKYCRSHSLVEFVPNSPDHVTIDGKVWHTKSNE